MINNLPSEILQHIFHKLHEKRDRKRMRLVCKRWHELLRVETIIIDPSRRGHAYKKLLIDLNKYPEFSTGLKKLVIRDSYWYDAEDDLCYGSVESEKDKVSPLCSNDLVGDTFSSIVQYCHHLTGVEISMSCSKNLIGHVERLQDMSRLESLCLDLIIDYQSPHAHSDNQDHFLLDPFFERFGSSLRFFTITQIQWEGNINYCWGMGDWPSGLLLTTACKAIGKTIHLEKIEIIGGCYVISKECLEYFISGQLGCLNTLNLCVRVRGMTNGTEGTMWDQIKEYCVSHLKHYNILLASEGTPYAKEILFSFDNCINKEESYYQIYSDGVKNTGEFPEPLRCGFREYRMRPLMRY